MRNALLVTIALLMFGGCKIVGPDETTQNKRPDIVPSDLSGCVEIVDAVNRELAFVQYCTSDADCGQVLTNTSCGCTRDRVARLDADTDLFYLLTDLATDEQCELPFTTTCDCPPAEGFRCFENSCTWAFTDANQADPARRVDLDQP